MIPLRMRRALASLIVSVALAAIQMRDGRMPTATPATSNDAAASRSIRPLCGREDIRRGKWLERTEGNATEYRWDVPEGAGSCRFHAEFDPGRFCALMANAVVMVIGDSIMWEAYSSLVRLASDGGVTPRKRIHTRVTHHGTRGGFPVMVNVCNGTQATIIYRWSFHLEGIDRYLKEQFPTVIFLNTGAHYQADGIYRAGMDRTIGLLEGWQEVCRGRNLTCPFYWRTTAPGIPNCMSFTRPNNNITEMERFVEAESPGVKGQAPFYFWEKFKGQNEIALEMLESSKLDYGVIPGYEIGIQRPDTRVSEGDCLHSRNPAIADAENIVMLHHLRSSRTAGDVLEASRYRYDFDRGTNVKPDGSDLDWDLVNQKDYPY